MFVPSKTTISSFIGTVNLKDNTIRKAAFQLKGAIDSVFIANFTKELVCLRERQIFSKDSSDVLFFISLDEQVINLREEFKHEEVRGGICEFDPEVYIESSICSSNGVVKMRKFRPVLLKNFYMQGLLHINQDFDDDLLSDCMDILIQ